MQKTGTVFRGKAKIIPPDTFFLPYQKRWIEDESRLKLMEKGRQIGLSLSTAYRCVEKCAAAGNRNDIWVSSRDDLQAKLFVEDCKRFADALSEAYRLVGAEIRDGKTNDAAYVLRFANGSEIHSLSSNADAQAGKRGTRVLDEFALHPDPRKLYGIAYPGITWGGNLEIISTHRGSDNFFNRLVEEARGKNPKHISLHRVTLQDALEQGFLYKLQKKLSEAGAEGGILDMDEADYFDFVRKGCADNETFQQEYMCNPADDNAAFLSYEVISKCQYRAGEEWRTNLSEKSDLFLGVDLARVHDLTVFWLAERLGGVLYTRDIQTLRDTPFSEQESVLHEYLSNPRVRRCCIDMSGSAGSLPSGRRRATARPAWRGCSSPPPRRSNWRFRCGRRSKTTECAFPPTTTSSPTCAPSARSRAFRATCGLSPTATTGGTPTASGLSRWHTTPLHNTRRSFRR